MLSLYCTVTSATPTYRARAISLSAESPAELKYSEAADSTNLTDSLNEILQTNAGTVFFLVESSEEMASDWTGIWCELCANN